MEHVDSSQLPSDKKGKKFFLLSNSISLPFDIPNIDLLSPNGKSLAPQFEETKGKFLGGGVFKSDDFKNEAKKNPKAMEINQYMKMQISRMSPREVIKISPTLTPEWMAFEYSVVFSVTMYGFLQPIRWEQFSSINIKKKGITGMDSQATFTYSDSKGNPKTMSFQANSANIHNFGAIAKACGVEVN